MGNQILSNEQFFLNKDFYIDEIIHGATTLIAYKQQHFNGIKITYPFDFIVIHGANMQKDKYGRWTLPTIVENDPGKVVGGWYRAKAAVEAYRLEFANLFIVTGGFQRDTDGSLISRAEVLAKKIIYEGHMPKNMVIPINSITPNTVGNIESIIQYLIEQPEILKSKKLGIISSYYHMPRVILIYRENKFFMEQDIELIPLPAEWLLLLRPQISIVDWVRKLYSRPEMETRQILENKGVKSLTKENFNSL